MPSFSEVIMSMLRKLRSSVNSFMGVLSHFQSYGLRRDLFARGLKLECRGCFDKLFLKFT